MSIQEEIDFCYEQIARLRADYERAAEPFFKRIVACEARRVPRYFVPVDSDRHGILAAAAKSIMSSSDPASEPICHCTPGWRNPKCPAHGVAKVGGP